jgi:hypothetical protein
MLLPPPVDVIVEKIELDPFVPEPPPAPTVTVYEVPAVTENPVPVLKPPAPPPPPLVGPPPPPPATTRYSTSVTPVGQTHVLDAVKVSTNVCLALGQICHLT